MKRFGALLICCFLLGVALRPALPVFVCASMDGARLSRPCCPGEFAAEGAEPAGKTWAARCCHSELPTLVDASRPPPQPQRSGPVLWAGLRLAAPFPPPAAPAASSAPRRHGEPPSVGPPPPLRSLLRI